MRARRRAIVSLGVVVLLFATGLSGSTAAWARASSTARGFVRSCDGGRGVTVPTPDPSDLFDDDVARLSSGVVVTMLAYEPWLGADVAAPVVLEAVSPDCTPDVQFGRDGREDLRWPGGFTSGPQAVLAATGGGLFIAGSDNNKLALTELLATGAPDRSFGSNGWLIRSLPDTVPYALSGGPYVAALAEQPDGTLLVGSSNGDPHTSTVPRVYAFAPDGTLTWVFAPMPTLRSRGVFPVGAEINQLLSMPDGSTAVLAQIEFPACGTQVLAILNGRGSLENARTRNLNRDVAMLPKNGLNEATGFVGPDGDLTFVGSLQRRCDSDDPSLGFMQHVGPPRTLRHHSFEWLVPNGSFTPSIMLANGDVVGFGPGNARGSIDTLTAYLGSGREDRAFGPGGSESVRSCTPPSARCPLIGPTLVEGVGVVDVLVPRLSGLRLLEVTQ